MNRKIISVVVIILTVLWLGFIFFMSSQTAENSSHMSKKITKVVVLLGENVGFIEDGASDSVEIINKYNLDIRKIAHVFMYFLLACLIFATLWRFKVKKILSIIISFSISLCIAFIDEINQMNFSGRNSGVFSEGIDDIFRDAFGIGMAIVLLLAIRVIKEVRSKNVR